MLLLKVFLCFPLLAQQFQGDLKSYIEPMRKNLMEDILQFWYPRGVDTANGGYQMHFDAKGNPKAGTKMIVTQARMVWFYARMARAGHGDKQKMLAASDNGVSIPARQDVGQGARRIFLGSGCHGEVRR